MTNSGASRSRGIQSVEIGLRVLTALSRQPGPASLSAIAAASGLSASQTHRYLSSLIAAGMVRQSPATAQYDLDAGAIRIGLAALSRLDVIRLADAAFAAFAAETGRTCLLAVWGDRGPCIVRWFAGDPPGDHVVGRRIRHAGAALGDRPGLSRVRRPGRRWPPSRS